MTESNANAAAGFMKELHDKAEKLRETRAWLSKREEQFKKDTEEHFALEASLKGELLQGLKVLGLKSVKVSTGESVIISTRKSFAFSNEIAMTKWAQENNLVRPDKELMKQKLTGLLSEGEKLPKFVEVVESESISLKKAPEAKKETKKK